MKIIVAGGTGFIGGSLVQGLISRGHEPVLLSRGLRKSGERGLRYLEWDGRTLGTWAAEVGTAGAVINLAGEAVALKRWSTVRKKEIFQSRILATRVLVEAIAKASRRPDVLINASAVGYYGNVPHVDVSETHPEGKGFLAETCIQWEKEALRAEAFGVRTVLLRTGIVLGKKGGALAKMVPPFLFFIGGPLGSGKQWVPWIHQQDVERAIVFALENGSVSGPLNLTAPHSVTMREFCAELGKVLGRPSWAPVPAVILKALLGEMSGMFLEGQKAVPLKLLERGYVFKFPDLRDALKEILKSPLKNRSYHSNGGR